MKKLQITILLLVSVFFAGDGLMSKTSDLAKFEKAKALFKSGIKHFNRMEYLAAAEFFRNSVQVYPEYYSARDYLARSYHLAGFVDSASKELSSLQSLYPDDVIVASRIETLAFRDSFSLDSPVLDGLIYKEILWSKGMRNYSFTKPVDIAIDKEKNMYITSFDSGKLLKLDSNGKGLFVKTPNLSGKLYGLDYKDGTIAVSDFKNDVIFFYNSNGKNIGSFGGSGNGDGLFHGPQGVCFGEGGYIYVVDAGNNRIQKFDSSGKFILKFGKKGTYAGEMSAPSDIAFSNGLLYISDTENKRIAIFDVFGNFVENILMGELKKPQGVSVMGQSLLVSDETRGLLVYNIITKEINWLESFDNDNRFSKLMSASFDRDGFLYCLDHAREAVLVFSPEHKQYSNLDVDIVSVDTQQFPVVAFYVNIRDRRGTPLVSLNPENFIITEDNARIRYASVDYLKSRVPSVSTILCVDRSLENKKNHNELSWFADFYLTKMHQSDSVKVVGFNNDYWEESKFDWSRRRTLQAIKKEEYGPGKNIGKTLYNALSELGSKLNRRAIIMLTDGTVKDNSFAQYSPRTIIHYAKSHFIPVYIISIGPPDETLVTIARETGGDVYRPGERDKMGKIYSSIKNSEEYRYVLVYSTLKGTQFKGWWSNVKIEVDYKGMKGLEWGGYFIAE